MSGDIMIYPVEHAGGVQIRICRRKTEDPAADAAPLEMTHGVLDLDLDFETLCRLYEAITRALLAKIRQFS